MEKKMKIGISILIIAILIILPVSSYMLSFRPEEKTDVKETKDVPLINDTTNQILFFTLHRIRKKGIIDQMFESGVGIWENLFNMGNIKITSDLDRWIQSVKALLDNMRPGFGWDKKPVYSFILTIDDYTWDSEQVFKTWDTGYMDRTVFRDIGEGNETADVTFKIIENTQNRFGKKTGEKIAENIYLQYDFKTGRWNGGDYFNDSDGYGHYNGSNFEVWLSLSQTSSDGDDIPWWIETNVLKTSNIVDDSKQDPDNDGIPTEWEWKWGYDPFTWDNHTFLDPDDDGIQNIEEYQISEWLSNPFHPEMYIECDSMEQTPRFDRNLESPDGWTHEFYRETQEMIMERFNQHGITVHIDDGCMGGGGDLIPFDKGGEGYPMGDFSQERGVAAGIYDKYFTKNRKGIFRYVAICYKGGWCHPQDNRHCYDCIFVPHGRKAYNSMSAGSLNERAKRIAQAVSIFHEIGHSCGFNPGIYDMYHEVFSFDRYKIRNLLGIYPNRDITVEEWDGADYISAMSYEYYYYSYFDFSDGTHGPHDNNDWANLDLSFFQRPSPNVEGLE
jgi:hypothetical protein